MALTSNTHLYNSWVDDPIPVAYRQKHSMCRFKLKTNRLFTLPTTDGTAVSIFTSKEFLHLVLNDTFILAERTFFEVF